MNASLLPNYSPLHAFLSTAERVDALVACAISILRGLLRVLVTPRGLAAAALLVRHLLPPLLALFLLAGDAVSRLASDVSCGSISSSPFLRLWAR